jgi:hypothetical protein
MKTPFGAECRYFYGDYYRGKNVQECRLIGNAEPPNHWEEILCQDCPVPAILMANACQNMVLSAKVSRKFLWIKKSVIIEAYCKKTNQAVKNPYVGCGECHPLPDVFKEMKK